MSDTSELITVRAAYRLVAIEIGVRKFLFEMILNAHWMPAVFAMWRLKALRAIALPMIGYKKAFDIALAGAAPEVRAALDDAD